MNQVTISGKTIDLDAGNLIKVRTEPESGHVILETEGMICSSGTFEDAKAFLLSSLGMSAITNMFVDGLTGLMDASNLKKGFAPHAEDYFKFYQAIQKELLTLEYNGE